MATILIIDDNPANRDVVVTLLGYYGHRLLEATDGVEGLEMLGAEKPDLVITDILMPTMNGFEFVSKMRQQPATALIPVIFYSATFADKEMRSLANACGVSRLLLKPAEPEEVLRLVNAALTSPDPAGPQVSLSESGIEVVQILNKKLFEKNNELLEMNAQLEQRIRERTADLERTNILLQKQIEERERTESELRQVQRLDAIGRLAGGLAHDFNNLLAIVLGQSERLLARTEDWESSRMLESIKSAVERGMSLTFQLLAFARRQPLETRLLNFNVVLESVEKLLRVTLGENIELVIQPEADLGNIKANPTQLEQVLMNLAFNARDAMPEGGCLTIRTSNMRAEAADEKRFAIGAPGPYVCLAVTDTGCGMDEETQNRLFEPYFTTKGLGKGTGLGLSTVYGIVKQSGGQILVYSEPGRGTTFTIYWPQVESPAAVQSPATPRGLSPEKKTILVVEDNAPLLEITSEMLQESGFAVIQAQSPEEAIKLADAHKGTIDLLVTDVLMPKMNGRELAAKLTGEQPHMKVLYVSGNPDDTFRDQGETAKKVAFLQKPFTRQVLNRKIWDVIGSRSAAPDAARSELRRGF